jgi:transposase
LTSKIHIAVDGLGNPLRFILTPGQWHDITRAEDLVEGLLALEIIRERQAQGAKPAKSKAAPKVNLVLEPKNKVLKPILPKLATESTEGESLPGLDVIRRQQLENSKTQ